MKQLFTLPLIFAVSAQASLSASGAASVPSSGPTSLPISAPVSLGEDYQARANALLIRGAVVGTISSSGVQTKSTFGDANSDRSLFEIGSISKSFTGIAAALLSVEKKLNLEAPISDYIPELKGYDIGKVTAHELANHEAGLVDNYSDASGKTFENFTEDQLIAFLKTTKPIGPAGTPQYSDLGFSTLGLVLSRIEKKDFPEIIRDKIFKPLSMKDTGYFTGGNYPQGLLQGYDASLKPGVFGQFPLCQYEDASGGIYSDLHDMMIFLNANMHPGSNKLGKAIKLSHQLVLGWDNIFSRAFYRLGKTARFLQVLFRLRLEKRTQD
jgi:CubicO group peptidase (beta-lactamase class C family)